METQIEFFRHVDDMRGFPDIDESKWRSELRERLFKQRKGRSDLTRVSLVNTFDLHEGILPRHWLGKQNNQMILFSGVNCFILSREEHQLAPDRTTCYWLAVIRYDKERVDAWIESLPFKVPVSKPWIGSNGYDVIAPIPDEYTVDVSWYTWFDQHKRKIDIEA